MYLKIRVNPDSKKESVERKNKETLVVSVKVPAKRNLANERALELISQELNIPKKEIRIISGHHSRSKLLSIKEK